LLRIETGMHTEAIKGIDNDCRLATTSYDGELRLYSVAQGGTLTKLVEANTPGGKRPHGLAFHPDGSRIAVGYEDSRRVDVVDGHRLTPPFVTKTQGVDNGSLAAVAWIRDGRTLVAAGMWHRNGKFPTRIWPDAGRGQPLDTPLTNSTVNVTLRGKVFSATKPIVDGHLSRTERGQGTP
jgi:WD40 repeat protein